jgi:hypothetical protein
MSNKLISDLPAASSVGGSDLFEIEQGGISKKALASLVGTGGGGSGNDVNDNYTANNFLSGYSTTATAAGTTTLTVASEYQQYFTGTTTQSCVLPVTSTLTLGHRFFIANHSTGDVTVQSSGLNEVVILTEDESALVTCILTSGTTGASWSVVTSSGTAGPSTGVDTVGIPVANQIPIWTDPNTLKGTSGFTVDTSNNLFTNNVNSRFTSTATAGTTTTLTLASSGQQYFTGTLTQTVLLPVVSTLTLGHQFYIYNASTDVVTVQSSGAADIVALTTDTAVLVTCILTSGTGAASWLAISTPEPGSVAVGDITGLGTNVATALANNANAAGGFTTINGTAALTNKTIALDTNTVTVYTTKYSAGSHTLATTEVYGGVIYQTGAGTIVLPAVAAGMSVTVITIGAVAVSVDPNASEILVLDGTSLTGGHKATNLSTAGDIITLTYYAAGEWYAASNGWTDGG